MSPITSAGEAEDGSPPPDPRRERGKLAQRAYRKRHASKFQTLQEENRRLRDAIKAVNDVVVRDVRTHRWPELAAAAEQARQTAGLSSGSIPAAKGESSGGNAPVAPLDDVVAVERSQSYPPPRSAGLAPRAPNVEPLINCNVYDSWLEADPIVTVSDPPSDIIPFLGEGSMTLAGCLYWAGVTLTLGLWNPPASVLKLGQRDQQVIDSIFSHSDGHIARGCLMTHAKARLDYYNQGSVSMRASDQRQLEDTLALGEKIQAGTERQGDGVQWWRTPLDVERYVRQKLQPHEMERVQASIEKRGPDMDRKAVNTFLGSMSLNYKCFGDGPRWNAVFATMSVGILVKKLRGDREGYLHDSDELALGMLT